MPEETFRWVIAGAVAISTLCFCFMVVVSLGIYRAMRRVRARVESVSDRVEPLIDKVQKLADENAPKISGMATRASEIADNAKDISDVARDQAHRFAEVGRDVADRTKAQVARMDMVVDQTVNQVQCVGEGVKDAVMRPVREAGGVVAGIKAAVSTYAAGRRPTVDHITQDEEMFI
jgi:methyl-accepting chemotaxis protein